MADEMTVGSFLMDLALGGGTNMADDSEPSVSEEEPRRAMRVHKIEAQGFITQKGEAKFAHAVAELQDAWLTVYEKYEAFFRHMPSDLRESIHQDEFLNSILSRDGYYEAFAPLSAIIDQEDNSCPLDEGFAYLQKCGFTASIRREKNGYSYVKIKW